MTEREQHENGTLVTRALAEPTCLARLRYLKAWAGRFDASLIGELVARADAAIRVEPARAVETAHLAVAVARDVGDATGRAEAYRALGDACVVYGRFAPALRAIERAARHARLVDDAWAARLDAQRLHPLVHLERYDEARAAGESAIRQFAALGDRKSQLRTLMALADLEYRLDRPGSALRLFAQVDRLLPEDMAPRFRGVLAANRANALEAVHRFRAAERHFERATRLFAEAGCEHSSAQVEYNACYFQFLRGRYGLALLGYRRIEPVFQRLGDERHLALIDLDRAEIHLRLNMPRQADALAAGAALRFQALGMEKERAQAVQLCGAAAEIEGHWRGADAMFVTAQEAFGLLGLEARRLGCLLQRANVALRSNRLAEARELVAEAAAGDVELPLLAPSVELLRARLDAQSQNPAAAIVRVEGVLALSRRIHAPWLRIEALRLAAQTHVAQGDVARAVTAYRQAIDELERHRGGVPPDEYMASFLAGHASIYAETAHLLVSAGDVDGAFEYTERRKSRALAELLEERWKRTAPARTFHEQRVTHLRERLDAMYRRLLSADKSTRGDTDRAAERLEERLATLLREGRLQRGGTVAATEPVAPSLNAIQSRLEPGTMMLQYLVTPDSLLAFGVTRDAVRVVSQGVTAAELESLVARFRFHVAQYEHWRPPAAAPSLDATRQNLQRLSALLLEPFRHGIEARRLVVMPDGPLHGLPFHALPWGEGWAADAFEFVYAPSAAVYELCRTRPSARGPAAVFGIADTAAPEIEREAFRVAGLLGTNRLFLGQKATMARLREAARDARVLHVATHGVLCWDEPMLSALRLADTWLNSHDAYELEVGAELVVLAACNSGSASVTAGGDPLGVTRGFLCAGARALLASQWRVSDGATAELMEHFYTGLRGGAGAAEALNAAMATVRARRPHPYYWAPFFLLGCPSPAPPSRGRHARRRGRDAREVMR